MPFKQPGLVWSPGLTHPIPKWTIEPKIDTIRSLFRKHLDVDEDVRIDIEFLGDGTFNKSYTISPADRIKDYVFRVSLPVEPFYKTESEVATLSYVRSHTLIPVPRILGFDASLENELGFEWILMEKVRGVVLDEIWKGLSKTIKISITKEIAGYICQLREQCRFKAMGNLYHRKALEKIVSRDKIVKIDGDRGALFAVGPIVSAFFFSGRRVRIAGDRGPFFSDRDYIESHIRLELDDMALLLKSQPSEDRESTRNQNEDNIVEYDEDLAQDASEIRQSCFDLLSLLPNILQETPPSRSSPAGQKTSNEDENAHHRHRFVLHHDDLSLSNILVDPKTHRITGIIDWECASIHPRWQEETYPRFLAGPDVDEGLSPFQDKDEEKEFLTEHKQNLEKMQLRAVFDQVVANRMGWDRSHGDMYCDDDGLMGIRKKEFMEHLMLVEFSTKAVKRWISSLKDTIEQGASEEDD